MQQKKGIAALLALTLLVTPITPVFAQSIEELQEENKQRQIRVEEVQSNINTKVSERSAVLDEIEVLDQNISELAVAIDEIEVEITDLETEIDKNKEEIKRLEKRIEENETLFAERVNSMFKSPKGSYMQVLLNSGDLADLMSRSQMMQSMADFDKSLIAALKGDREKLEKVKADLASQMEALEEKKTELADERDQLSVAAEQKNNYVSSISAQISNESALKDALIADMNETDALISQKIEEARIAAEERRREEERLAAEAEERRRAAEAAEEAAREAAQAEAASAEETYNNYQEENSNYASLYDALAWPVPSSYNITDYFGGRIHPITGVYHQHLGIDVGAGTGSGIVAAQSGTVILASWNGGYGNCVMIDHGNGMVTLYGHMNSIYVGAGTWVEKGQTIGEIGNTGMSTGPHLHFEVSVNGGRQNPMNYLQ